MNFDRIKNVKLKGGQLSVCMKGTEGHTDEVLHSLLARLVNALHELQDMVREAVDDGHADIVVVLILIPVRS